MPTLLFVVSSAAFFVSHRLQIAKDAVAAGYAVAVACPADPVAEGFAALGIAHIPITMRRSGSTGLAELRSLLSVRRAIRQARPDVIHLITAKPVIYGGLVARGLGIPTVAAIAGLGHLFIGSSGLSGLRQLLVSLGYRAALNHRLCHVIFQNAADEAVFQQLGILRRASATRLPGSGADLALIRPCTLPQGDPVLLLPARMIYNKGVQDFVQAARLLKVRGIRATFRLLGSPDPGNPTGVPIPVLQAWAAEGIVEWHPHTAEIAAALAAAHIVVLPTHGGEGLPKTLIDAAAAGRVAAASDVPGCREAIVPGETGLLFRPRDPEDMARVLAPLIADRGLQVSMGAAARRRAEQIFDLRDVSARHLRIYAALLAKAGQG